MTNSDLARAFSEHRFRETYDHLTDDVRWVNAGASTETGRDAVVAACEAASAEMAASTLERLRLVVADGGDAVAVDTLTRYTEGSVSTTVASCDFYEFEGDRIAAITSYAVEA
jgi:limonene-1,2-epoxide hydrolase